MSNINITKCFSCDAKVEKRRDQLGNVIFICTKCFCAYTLTDMKFKAIPNPKDLFTYGTVRVEFSILKKDNIPL